MRINYEIIRQAVRVINETTLLTDNNPTNFAYGEKQLFVSLGDVLRYYKRKLQQLKHGRRNYIRDQSQNGQSPGGT